MRRVLYHANALAAGLALFVLPIAAAVTHGLGGFLLAVPVALALGAAAGHNLDHLTTDPNPEDRPDGSPDPRP